MGFVIGEQLRALGASALLGAVLALLYDLLRALRHGRALTAVLDGLYCAAVAVSLTAFSLRVGGGELRLYMLLGAALGAVLFFALLSPLLRPLWDFWAGVLGATLRLFCLPAAAAKKACDKLHKFCKKGFLFLRNAAIIKNWGRVARAARFRAEKREGRTYGTKGRSQAHRGLHGRKAGGAGDAGGRGRAAGVGSRAQ